MVLIATGAPVVRMTPLDTTPPAPAPKREPASSSMSSGNSLYSRPPKVMPVSGEICMPLGLWRIVPPRPSDQVPEADWSSSDSSNANVGGIHGRFADGALGGRQRLGASAVVPTSNGWTGIAGKLRGGEAFGLPSSEPPKKQESSHGSVALPCQKTWLPVAVQSSSGEPEVPLPPMPATVACGVGACSTTARLEGRGVRQPLLSSDAEYASKSSSYSS
mmetsp:Transcript_3749/g.9735  ORF Transcript_3749/g.9735 Transcript_3749/m.9735 type:complete len:218 (+) Transcript_3749:752-1405(+)